MTVAIKKITVIEWVDSVSVGANVWADRDAVRDMKPDIIISVGFIQDAGEEHITLAAHSGFQVSGDMCIPRTAIRRMKHIPYPFKTKK